MARRFQKSDHSGRDHLGEINVIPLIDVLFILLLFFIVTTVFVDETGIEIEKPRAATQSDIERDCILIGITPGGQVYYSGREIGVAGVRSVIAKLAHDKDKPVIIQADKGTPTETTVAVLDEAKLGGAAKVYVSTVNE